MRVINALALSTLLIGTAAGTSMGQNKPAAATAAVAVGPQYDSAHVYVPLPDLDRFSDSVIATFGGTKSSFRLDSVTQVAGQHDALVRAGDVLSVFDNGGGPPRTRQYSRGLVVRLDPRHKTVKPLTGSANARLRRFQA